MQRLKDLVDVQELIRVVPLERPVGGALDASVAWKFFELWDAWHQIPRKYFLVVHKAEDFTAYLEAGLEIDQTGSPVPDETMFVTTDPGLARRFKMEEMNG